MEEYRYEIGEIVNIGYGSGGFEIVDRERGWMTGQSVNFYRIVKVSGTKANPGDIGRKQRVTESFLAGKGADAREPISD